MNNGGILGQWLRGWRARTDWAWIGSAQLLADPVTWEPVDAVRYLLAAVPGDRRQALTPRRREALRSTLRPARNPTSRESDLIVIADYLNVRLPALLDRETGLVAAHWSYLTATHGPHVQLMPASGAEPMTELERLRLTVTVLDAEGRPVSRHC